MARRVVESATLRGHDACARLRVFAVARGTKASQRIYDVYVGNAGSEHYPRGWARRRAVMQKRVRRLPDVSGRTQQSAPPPNHPANVGLTRLGGLVVLVSDRGAFLCQFNYALLKDLTVFLSSRLVGILGPGVPAAILAYVAVNNPLFLS